MGADNTTTAFANYKRVYGENSDSFVNQQNLLAPSWKKFKLSPLKLSPQGTYLVVSMTGNETGGAINETQAFQDPGNFNPQNPVVLPKTNVIPIAVTGNSIELSKNNVQAFAATQDAIMTDGQKRLVSAVNRQGLGKGTGQLTLANGAGAATSSLVVDNALPFRRNMRLDLWTALPPALGGAGVKEVSGATVTNVNYNTNTLTLDANYSWSDNDIIVLYTVLDNPPTGGKEITGLQAICDTTTYSTTFEGLAVSSNPEWVGNVISAGGVPVSQDLLQQTYNRIRSVGGGNPNFLISNNGQQRVFLNSELQKVRYEPATVEGGATVLKWMDMEWLYDKDYDISEVGMYDLNHIEKLQTREMFLADYSGNTAYQVVGYDQIGMYYKYVSNLATDKRNAHGRLTGLTEPTF